MAIASPYEAVFLDIDGTLKAPLPHAMPSRNVKDSITSAIKMGVEVAVITGQPEWMSKNFIDYLGIRTVCAFNNGSQLVNYGKRDGLGEYVRIADEVIDLELQAAALEACKEFGIPLYDSHSQYRYPHHPIAHVEVEPYEGNPLLDNPKLFVDAIPRGQARELITRLNAIPGLTAVQSTSWRDVEQEGYLVDVHITLDDATKAEAASLMADVMDINERNVIVVGDSHNDLAMFAVAGLSVAMGNAPDEVKDKADVVVSSHAEDGVVQVFERYIFGSCVEVC